LTAFRAVLATIAKLSRWPPPDAAGATPLAGSATGARHPACPHCPALPVHPGAALSHRPRCATASAEAASAQSRKGRGVPRMQRRLAVASGGGERDERHQGPQAPPPVKASARPPAGQLIKVQA